MFHWVTHLIHKAMAVCLFPLSHSPCNLASQRRQLMHKLWTLCKHVFATVCYDVDLILIWKKNDTINIKCEITGSSLSKLSTAQSKLNYSFCRLPFDELLKMFYIQMVTRGQLQIVTDDTSKLVFNFKTKFGAFPTPRQGCGVNPLHWGLTEEDNSHS